MEIVAKLTNAIDCIPTKLKIEKYPYTVLKIIPYKTGYKAKDFDKVINTLSKYNNDFFERFELIKDTKTLVYHPQQSLCYEVLFTKNKITYYYAIPTIYKSLFINKVKFLLEKCDICEDEDYLQDFAEGYRQRYKLKQNWMFAINTDDKVNITDSLLVLNKDLQDENDKVLIQYMMQPLFDYQWKNKWDRRYKKYAEKGTVDEEFSILDGLDKVIDKGLYHIDMIINALMSAFCGDEPIDPNKEKINYIKDLAAETKHKSVYDGFKINLNVYYQVEDTLTRDNISRNIATIMLDLKGDNSLAPGKAKFIKKVSREMKGGFTLNSIEARQFINTPSEKMMQEFEDILDKVNVAELEMPKDLFKSQGILLGEMMRGSTYKQINFGRHANSKSKPLVYISPQEGGKTSFSIMYDISAIEDGDSVFAFDTIDGKTIANIRDYLPTNFPDEKIIVLDFANENYIFPLMWNEVSDVYYEKLQAARDKFEKYQVLEDFGSQISNELIRFIETFQMEDKNNRLTPAMKSTLSELAQLVFMTGGSFGDIKECLYNKKLRHDLIEKLGIPRHLPIARNILKLDDEATYTTTIRGIETRLNIILNNATLNKYFSVNDSKKLDFAYWANNGYCVLIKIPQNLADVLVTFLTQKLWLACTTSRYNMAEDERPHTHLTIDEPNRFPTIMDLLCDHIIASRKWHLRFLFFIHNMDIFRNMKENLRAAGTSFIMLPTTQYNFGAVAEFFQPYDYSALKEVEKLISKSNGKRRFALCSIHYQNANYPCVVRLPLPVEQRYKYVDRSYLNEKCAEQYGFSQRQYYERLFGEVVESEGKDGIDKGVVNI